MKFFRTFSLLLPCATALALAGGAAWAQSPLKVYDDHLLNGFQDWGWTTHNYTNSAPVHSGTNSISVTIDGAWGALQIYHVDTNSSAFGSVSFWLHGGTNGGQRLQVYGLLHVGTTNNAAQSHVTLSTPLTTNWQQVTIPLASLGVANKTNFTGFVIQDVLGTAQPTFYVDDIQLNSVLVTVQLSLNATQAVRSVESRWAGVNTAIWDSTFDTPTTISLLKEMGMRFLRGPGGSASDEYHWLTDRSGANTWQWATSFANFTHVATNVGAQTVITVNYGTGSTNEAAAWVAYANAATTSAVPLGVDAAGFNWQTAGYWASLRAAARLGTDDGRNFLRLSRAAGLGFKYWEIGNECYGTWETDSNTFPNDAYTYALRANDYYQLMKAVDPTIKVGVVVTPGEDASANGYTSHPAHNPRTGQNHNGWTPVLLTTLKNLGMTPDFLVHHRYPEWSNPSSPAGADNDAFLLQCSTAWASDAANLRQQVTDYFGAAGTNIELICTENNADAGAQGKQSTSLVNGLYYADSLCQLMQTEFNALVWWDLRNGTDTGGWFDSSVYGWRTFGDLGMINGLNTKLPSFYAAKLMQSFAQPGDTVVKASSDYTLLAAYAARRASGAHSLLVLNKDPATPFNAQVAVTGFAPNRAAAIRSFGIPQDEAARTNGPVAAQDIATNSFSEAGSSFSYSFPPLSITLFTLAPAAPTLAVVGSGAGNQFILQLQGQPNVRYVLQASTDLSTWSNVATNTLTGSTLNFTNDISAVPGLEFWRAVWQP